MIQSTLLPEGTLLDNYRISRRLGRGGFGITYLASEMLPGNHAQGRETVLREVAVKEFFPQGIALRLPDGSVVAHQEPEGVQKAFTNGLRAFLKEAHAIAQIEHENVVRVYRVFEARGTAYLVMPYIKGQSLRALLRREAPVPENRARQLLLPVLDGLAQAHGLGILHRDIKPDNVMIREGDGKPVLIDFGTSRMQAADDVEQYTRMTDLVAYTPGYAAPEQYSRAASLNRHGQFTDIYAFAAMLYEAVTGLLPPESVARSIDVQSGRPDPLKPVTGLRLETGQYTRAFLSAIDWGLELNAAHRPQSIFDWLEALEGRSTLPKPTLDRLEHHSLPVEAFTVPVYDEPSGAPTEPYALPSVVASGVSTVFVPAPRPASTEALSQPVVTTAIAPPQPPAAASQTLAVPAPAAPVKAGKGGWLAAAAAGLAVLAALGFWLSQRDSKPTPDQLAAAEARAFFDELAPLINLTAPPSDLKVSLTGNHPNGRYAPGEELQLSFSVDQDAYVLLLNTNAGGETTVLFPNEFSPSNFVRAGQQYQLPTPEMGFKLRVAPPFGNNLLKLIASSEPVQLLNPTLLGKSGAFNTYGGNVETLSRSINEAVVQRPAVRWAMTGYRFTVAEGQ